MLCRGTLRLRSTFGFDTVEKNARPTQPTSRSASRKNTGTAQRGDSPRNDIENKMKTFKGFTDLETFTQFPDTFFHQLLNQIEDAAELKVTLYLLWRVEHMDGRFRALREADFEAKAVGLVRGRDPLGDGKSRGARKRAED